MSKELPKVHDPKYDEVVEQWSAKEKSDLWDAQGFIMKIGDSKPKPGLIDWYRGEHTNFYPEKSNLKENNAVFEYLLKGYVPDSPFIKKSEMVTAFGSCFAEHMRNYLSANGYKTQYGVSKHLPIIYVAEGINNTYSLLEQFNWAYGTESVSGEYWIHRDRKCYNPSEEFREETKKIFDETKVFIFTLGLSEIWYDKENGKVFWRGIPRYKYDPSKHGFRLTTVEENTKNLDELVTRILEKNPDAKIIFTLSPVPLIATFRDVSCVAASLVSKSILRVSIENNVSKYKETNKVFYWPAYEIVKEFFTDAFEEDNRHPKSEVIEFIQAEFSKYYMVQEE